MALNTGTLLDMVELYVGKGGASRGKIPRKALREILNQKVKEFAARTAVASSMITRTTVSGQQEYELGADVLHITKVNYDGSRAHKITFAQVEEFKSTIS